jgi:hypothetical protein
MGLLEGISPGVNAKDGQEIEERVYKDIAI